MDAAASARSSAAPATPDFADPDDLPSAALPLLVAAPSSAAANAAAAASPEAATPFSPFKMACAAAGSSPPPLAGSEPATKSTSQFVDHVWSHTPLKMPAAMVCASQPMVTLEVHVPVNCVWSAVGVPRSMVTVEPS